MLSRTPNALEPRPSPAKSKPLAVNPRRKISRIAAARLGLRGNLMVLGNDALLAWLAETEKRS